MKNRMITVAMTGASGNMGQAVVREIMKLSFVRLKLLFLPEKRELKLMKKWIHYAFSSNSIIISG